MPGHRRATPDDQAAIAALLTEADDLHASLLPRYFRRSNRAARGRADLVRILSALDEVIFVVDESAPAAPPGALAGLVHAQIFDTPPQPALVQRRRCHIDSLIVTARARRGGLGSRLVDAAASWGRAKGAEELLLTVWAGNDAAERFYERLGFTRVSSVLAKPL